VKIIRDEVLIKDLCSGTINQLNPTSLVLYNPILYDQRVTAFSFNEDAIHMIDLKQILFNRRIAIRLLIVIRLCLTQNMNSTFMTIDYLVLFHH
jgi:hypothetical protein